MSCSTTSTWRWTPSPRIPMTATWGWPMGSFSTRSWGSCKFTPLHRLQILWPWNVYWRIQCNTFILLYLIKGIIAGEILGWDSYLCQEVRAIMAQVDVHTGSIPTLAIVLNKLCLSPPSVCLSVRPSVCPSVYQSITQEAVEESQQQAPWWLPSSAFKGNKGITNTPPSLFNSAVSYALRSVQLYSLQGKITFYWMTIWFDHIWSVRIFEDYSLFE